MKRTASVLRAWRCEASQRGHLRISVQDYVQRTARRVLLSLLTAWSEVAAKHSRMQAAAKAFQERSSLCQAGSPQDQFKKPLTLL